MQTYPITARLVRKDDELPRRWECASSIRELTLWRDSVC
jgi:hypothetical protein